MHYPEKALLTLTVISLFLVTGCKKDPVHPTLATAEVTDITGSTARSGGTITSDGGAAVILRGVCWSKEVKPDTSDFKTKDGAGNGIFGSGLSGLDHVTKYYVRAYALNSVGITYGDELSFNTAALTPSVTTGTYSSLKATTVTFAGEVTADGGAVVIARGICWGTSASPTVNGNKTSEGTGTGSFSSQITELQGGTDYYARAYAINSSGTAYGGDVAFRTPAFSIGQSYGGGIIFLIDGSGEHGLIAASADQSSAAYWGCSGTNVATLSLTGAGLQNTVNIIAACSTAGIAASICYDLDLGGYTDWYLPSISELILMQENLYDAGMGNFSAPYYYWSSTQMDAGLAYYRSFEWDYTGGLIKSGYAEYYRQVRAVRSF